MSAILMSYDHAEGKTATLGRLSPPLFFSLFCVCVFYRFPISFSIRFKIAQNEGENKGKTFYLDRMLGMHLLIDWSLAKTFGKCGCLLRTSGSIVRSLSFSRTLHANFGLNHRSSLLLLLDFIYDDFDGSSFVKLGILN